MGRYFLGRVKGTHIKQLARRMVEKYPQLFTKTYAENMAKVREIGLLKGAKIEQHKLAGQIGSEVRKKLAGPRKRIQPKQDRDDRDSRRFGRGRDRDRDRRD